MNKLEFGELDHPDKRSCLELDNKQSCQTCKHGIREKDYGNIISVCDKRYSCQFLDPEFKTIFTYWEPIEEEFITEEEMIL